MVAVFHDISDLKRLEKIRKDFVANVSHELKTPVTVIKGYAEALLDGLVAADPERAIAFIEIIRNHIERQAELIGNLLALSELESDEFRLELLPLDLEGAARRAVTLVEPTAIAKNITVRITGFADLPAVLIDPVRIEQVFVNLLDNAIKYTPAGGEVELDAAVTGRGNRLSARQRAGDPSPEPGAGLRAVLPGRRRAQPRRRGPWARTGHRQAPRPAPRRPVWVESTPGKGSAFSFTLKRG